MEESLKRLCEARKPLIEHRASHESLADKSPVKKRLSSVEIVTFEVYNNLKM